MIRQSGPDLKALCKLALCSVLLAGILSAQQTPSMTVPTLIRYSGVLKDGQDKAFPSTTSVGVMFAIYKEQDGGAPIWQEMQNVTPDANGQYNVLLGSTSATGLPDDLFSQQEQRWLGVRVEGQEEHARVLLVSVPYAFKAHEADTLGGLPASAFLKAVPSGTNSTAVNTLTTVTTGGAAAAGIVTPGCSGTCTAGNVPVMTDTVGDLSNSLLSQAVTGPSVVNDSGSFNLSNQAKGYQIAGVNVLWYGTNPTLGNLLVGPFAGSANVTGNNNTYVGNATALNALGSANTYVGYSAGWSGNKVNTGSRNTFLGEYAGAAITSGNENTYLGYLAGLVNDTGSFNVDIANGGVAGENNTIRIGSPGLQSKAYLAGIVNNKTTNAANVYIDSNTGQIMLGAAASGVTGSCSSGSGNFAVWTSNTNLSCATNVKDSGGVFAVTGTVTATTDVRASGGFSSHGWNGLTQTVFVSDTGGNPCTLTFDGGILTSTTC